MYNSFEYEPWKVARDPSDKHRYLVVCCEDIRHREVLPQVWTDVRAAQDFANAANELYNISMGRGVAA